MSVHGLTSFRHGSRCVACGKIIHKGDPICNTGQNDGKGTPNNEVWVHEECCDG